MNIGHVLKQLHATPEVVRIAGDRGYRVRIKSMRDGSILSELSKADKKERVVEQAVQKAVEAIEKAGKKIERFPMSDQQKLQADVDDVKDALAALTKGGDRPKK